MRGHGWPGGGSHASSGGRCSSGTSGSRSSAPSHPKQAILDTLGQLVGHLVQPHIALVGLLGHFLAKFNDNCVEFVSTR